MGSGVIELNMIARLFASAVLHIFFLSAVAHAQWVDAPMSAWLEQVTREPVTHGNDVKLHVDGPEFYPVRLDLIRNAQRTIDLSTFLWCDDESGLAVARELARAARERRVRVRVLVDAFNDKKHDHAYGILEAAGIQPLIYNPVDWAIGDVQDRIHEKIMIVDGAKSLVGGANLCDEYMIGGPRTLWHDLELESHGPVSGRLQARFDQTWSYVAQEERQALLGRGTVRGDSVAGMIRLRRAHPLYRSPTPVTPERPGTATAQVQYQQPYMRRADTAAYKAVFTQLFRRATREITIYAPYLLPPRDFEDPLLEVARQGRKVRIVTNSPETTDMGRQLAAGSVLHYGPMLAAGIEIRESKRRTIHAKAILIDDTVLSIGSHNFTPRSFDYNGEANILTGDPGVIARFRAMYRHDFDHETVEVDMDEVRRRTSGLGNGLWSIFGFWVGGLY
jgi:phosphatidylserine/phosphatidylglycerophosphate/cardiolipin synthase-like enzyme